MRLPLHHFTATRAASALAKRSYQRAQDRASLAGQCDRGRREALGLLGIGINADDRELLVYAPLQIAGEQTRSHRQDHIRFAP